MSDVSEVNKILEELGSDEKVVRDEPVTSGAIKIFRAFALEANFRKRMESSRQGSKEKNRKKISLIDRLTFVWKHIWANRPLFEKMVIRPYHPK